MPNFGAGFRSGTNMIWTPIQHAKTSRYEILINSNRNL